jgi:putative transposase
MARNYVGRSKDFTASKVWARSYNVLTVGGGEDVIKNYIQHQEDEDCRINQLDLY